MDPLLTQPFFCSGTAVEIPNYSSSGERCFYTIENLKKGDEIVSEDGRIVKVRALIELKLHNSIAHTIDYDLITSPFQPVRRIQERVSRRRLPWKLSKDIGSSYRIPHGLQVWNLLLEDGGSMIRTHNWECVVIGHGIVDNPVTCDPYWSTNSAISDLVYLYKLD